MAKILDGKKVLLTGASKGIGQELACVFAREGAFLILCAEPATKGELEQCAEHCKSEGCAGCEVHTVDLAQGEEVTRWAEECLSKHGRIDVLVNNAAVFGPSGEEQGPLAGDPDEWSRMVAVNLKCPMRLTRALAPAMVDHGEGVIINITDVEATHTGPSHPAYAATKHALRGWSKSCYEALRMHNIKVVTINPGNVEQTGMAKDTSKTAGGQGSLPPSDVVEAIMFAFRVSANCVPEEITLKAVSPGSCEE